MRSAWVLSTGRSGTGAIAELIGLSPEVMAIHDGSPLRWDDWGGKDPIVGQRLKRMEQAVRYDLLYFEASNPIQRAAWLIAERYPKAKFVWLHRDPIATVLSGYHRCNWYGPGSKLTEHPGVWPLDEPTAAAWPKMSRIEKCIWRWTAMNTEALTFQKHHPYSTYEISLSALVAPNLSRVFELFEFLELSRPPAPMLMPFGRRKRDYSRHEDLVEFPYGDWDSAWDKYLPRHLMRQLGYA
jgi:hypothetical protein